MKTRDVEIETGLSKQTLYFYESEGLIEVDRNSNDYRNYSSENVQILHLIRFLRDLELSIEDIRLVLDGELSFKEVIRTKEQTLEKQMALKKDVQKTLRNIREKDLPLIIPFDKFEEDLDKSIFGYWKTSKKVSHGRRLTRNSLIRTLSNLLFSILVFTLALMIGIPTMLRRSVPPYVYLVIFSVLLIGAICFFLADLLATGSPVATSRFNMIEFEENGIRYYINSGFRENLSYVLNVIKDETLKSLSYSSYEEIELLKIKTKVRYMGGKLAMDVLSIDFDFHLKNGQTFYMVSPLLLNDDSYWVGLILRQKVKNIEDFDGILEKFVERDNVNSELRK